MNLLLLPGNSKRNKEWVHGVNTAVADKFAQTFVHEYRHWELENGFIDFDYELQQAVKHVQNFKPYNIFAKSVGSILTIRGVYEGLLQPESCVLVGLPLKLIMKENIPVRDWLSQTTIPIHIAQNDQDPAGSFGEVSSFLQQANLPHVRLTELVGDTHEYSDLTMLRSLLEKN